MKSRHIALLSNITTDMIKLKLSKSFDVYTSNGFNAWISDVYNTSSFVYGKYCDCIVILLDGSCFYSIENFQEIINGWKAAISFLLSNTDKPILINTIDVKESKIKTLSEVGWTSYAQKIWCDFLNALVKEYCNSYIIDLAGIISDNGRNNFYSAKMLYMGSMPFSKLGIQLVCSEITLAVNSLFESRKKILVLDLDNTLWGGVIGEDGIDGIQLSNHKEGQRYYDFQKQLKRMRTRGVLLAIVSKNNESDVRPVFKHPDMLLTETDFVSKKINWDQKSQNIKEIEKDLNITEGGFVFVDDNPVERNIVKGECCEVIIPDFPEDTTTLSTFAEDIYKEYFRLPRLLNEDKKKTEMYFSAAKRSEAKKNCADLDGYIKTLEINIDIHLMKDKEIARVSQLCCKTNQFNLTTKRYTESDITEMSKKSDYEIYVTYVNDKYGNDGLTSVLILKKEIDSIFIDSFLMSCRVMGRKIENAIINEISNKYKNFDLLNACFIPTVKNKPVENLYDSLGFEFVNEDDNKNKYYRFFLNTYEYKQMGIFKSISFCEGESNES